MASTYYAGLAACSGSSTGAIDSSGFDNVSITAGTVQPVPNGVYKIFAKHSARPMEVYSNGTANGSNVDQWSANDCPCQKWQVTNMGAGKYAIVGLSSGKYLDVNAASTADGANVQIWQSTGGDNQRFYFTPATDGYYRITPVHSGKAVEVYGNSTADGANVDQWTWNGGDNQQWMLAPVTASTTSGARTAVGQSTTATPVPDALLNEVIVYPNPLITQVTVKLSDEFVNGASVLLTDVTGRVLQSLSVKGSQYVLQLNGIPAGMYYVKISNGIKTVTKKIVKE
jgi:hypothetical protein